MISKAIERNIHISPRKAGIVCDAIRFKKVDDAIAQLENIDKKAALIILKLLKSAIANATNNHRMNAAKLYILSIVANEGPTMKRVLPRAKGSANTLRKRTSHIEIIISDDEKDRLLQKESYKKHNKYVELLNGKFDENSRTNLRMTRKQQLLKEEETNKNKNAKGQPIDNSEADIYTREEFSKIVLPDKNDNANKSKSKAKPKLVNKSDDASTPSSTKEKEEVSDKKTEKQVDSNKPSAKAKKETSTKTKNSTKKTTTKTAKKVVNEPVEDKNIAENKKETK